MTNIENQNDSLYSRIEELLESNKQIRQEIQQEQKLQQETGGSKSSSDHTEK